MPQFQKARSRTTPFIDEYTNGIYRMFNAFIEIKAIYTYLSSFVPECNVLGLAGQPFHCQLLGIFAQSEHRPGHHVAFDLRPHCDKVRRQHNHPESKANKKF